MNKKELLKYRRASNLQKLGFFSEAKEIFEDLLLKNISANERANVLFHLALMEETFKKKRTKFEELIHYNPNHKLARVYINLLIEENEKRVQRDKKGVIRQFFERYPLNIQIQTISSCNAKCKMCPYHNSWQKYHPGIMSDETFNYIVYILKDIPLGKVCLYLENEPFLDKKIIEKIEYVKENLNYKLIEISTNLSMFNDKLVHKLYDSLRNTQHEVWISWHGIDGKTYKNIMGFDFNRNLKLLKKYFEITKGEIKTSINTIVGSKLNETKIEAEERAITFFKNVVSDVGLSPDEIDLKIKTFYYHNRAGNIDEEITYGNVKQMIGKLKPNCCRIREWLHFLYDGDIILCCMDYKKKTVMGNVNNFNSLEKLLTYENFMRIQKMALGEIESPDDFICKRCTSPGG